MRIRAMGLAALITLLVSSLAGCFAPEPPSFYTCSTSAPRCPDAMACMPVVGLDSNILTDWKYERAPAVCMPKKSPTSKKDAGGDAGKDANP